MADIKADAIWSLSSALGSSDSGETQRTAQATVSRIDMDGTIWVRLVGSDADTPANGGSTAEVAPNDAVTVSIENGRCRITGCTSAPSTSSRAVDGKIEPIAETAKAADAAATAAQTAAAEAANVANAVNQHFFTDGNGVHVSTDEGDPAGAQNIIMNSAGVLLREQTANLAAFTPSAVSFYDGNGNQAANVTATFGTTGATIGKVGAAHSVIDSDGQRFYASNGSTQLANIGYGEGTAESGTEIAPYYTFGTRAANSTIGAYSVAEGELATASGFNSHAEGTRTKAAGIDAHAEGRDTEANGEYSHAEGQGSIASGECSHASGYYTTATKEASVAFGRSTHAIGLHQFVTGRWNDPLTGRALIIGNGTSSSARSNAFVIDWSGSAIGQAMAGMIQMFAGSTAPNGWLMCDGSAVSRDTYATLFAVIGTAYGAGDGSTTFNLPNLLDRFPMGRAAANSAIVSGGSKYLQAHTHAFTNPTVNSHSHGSGDDGSFLVNPQTVARHTTASGSGAANTMYSSGATSRKSSTASASPGTSGGAVGAVSGATTGSAGNLPPYQTVNFIICTGKTS